MKKIKKVMATVLLLCMISSMLVVPAAASEITASEISLNFAGKTLAVGGSFELKAVFEPEGAAPTVKWESSDPNVASVDETGLVTGLANGTAVIKASVYEGEPYAECTVTVVTETPEAPIVPVSGISLGEQTSLNLEPYGTATLFATVAPENATNKFVAWVSSDENVVTVDKDGNVYAVGLGSAVVSAIAADVDLSLPAEQLAAAAIANCIVTVSEPYVEPTPEPTPYVEPAPAYVPVSGISISSKELVMTMGDAPVNLTAAVNGDATNQNVYWTIDTVSVASVEGGVITPLSVGSAVIYAISEENSNIYETCVLTVKSATVPVSGISIDPTELTLTEGESANISAYVNSDATNQNIVWSVDVHTVASVDNGYVTALSAGNTTIYAVSEENNQIYAVCYLTVNPATPATVPVSGITISSKELVMTMGDVPVNLTAYVNADATNQNVYWTIDTVSVASVEGGVITPLSVGSAVIYAISEENGNIYETCVLTVKSATVPVSGISIDPTELTLTEGESANISAYVNSDATNQNIVWSVDVHTVASVDNGYVTALSAGNAVIYAVSEENGNIYAICNLTVNAPAPTVVPATSVTLEPNLSEITLKVGESADFTASVNAEATDKSLYWVSDDSTVASVDNGRVTANGSGRTTIYAVANGDTAYAACTVIVIAEPTAMFANSGDDNTSTEQQPSTVDNNTTIVISPAYNPLSFSTVETSYVITASLSDGSLPISNFKWECDGTAVSVVSSGNNSEICTVTINNVGSDKITLSYDGLTTVEIPVSVVKDIVEITTSTNSIVAGSTFQFVATSKYSNENKVVWSSSDPNVVSVDEDGLVTANIASATPVTITAKSKGDVDAGRTDPAFASCEVTVTAATVNAKSIIVVAEQNNVSKGGSVIFTATVDDAASSKELIWSVSENTLGTLADNNDGTATFSCNAYPAATTPITVTATAKDGGGASGSDTIDVAPAPEVSIVCEGGLTELNLKSNQGYSRALSASLGAGVLPTDTVTWASTNTDAVVVNGEGTNGAQALITIIGVGEAQITATHAGKTSSPFKVTVSRGIAVESVTITSTLELTPGGTATIGASVLPNDAEDRTLVWESDNADVTVDNNGNVEVAAGAQVNTTANITARAKDGSGKFATCIVTIKSSTVDVESVTIQGTAPSLTVGQTTSLGVTVLPTDATNKGVMWISENEGIATVDQNGFITAKAAGQTRIIARSVAIPSIQSVIDVYVSNAPASTGTLRITASPQNITSTNGYSVLTATVNGYVINGGVNWSVSDTNMATVSSNGVVTAKRAGSFVVTGIYDNNGTRYTGTVLITATPVITSGNYSNYDGRNIMYFKTNQTYPSWRSTDIVSVDGMQLRHGQHCYVGSSSDGYVLVALNPQYLNTLPSSVVHTIRIGPASSPAVGYFRTYTGQGTVINGVMTGDENQAALWAALCVMGLLGCATILISRRKDWN